MKTHLRTHKIQLDPTCKQKIYFAKACGTARHAWNWALSKWQESYSQGVSVNALQLKKEYNRLKKKEFSWVYEVTKYACQQPFIHLGKAFDRFFSKKAKYPKYKKKGIHDSFYIGGDQVKVIDKQVRIPNLGWVRLRESLRFQGEIKGVTVSRKADRWFISIHVETNQLPKQCENQACVGVDLGVTTFATFSNGEVIQANQSLKRKLKHLKRVQRAYSRKVKGSQNRRKHRYKLARLHYKIANNRNDHLHKVTTTLCTNYQHIVIEDLGVSNMVRNKKLSRSIIDCGFYEFRRQLEYKSKLRGNTIYIANRWYGSSKTCSKCGEYKESLSLGERTYRCTKCGIEIDRDLNAARNLEELVNTVSSTGIDACRQDGSLVMLKTSPEPAWMKQELSPV